MWGDIIEVKQRLGALEAMREGLDARATGAALGSDDEDEDELWPGKPARAAAALPPFLAAVASELRARRTAVRARLADMAALQDAAASPFAAARGVRSLLAFLLYPPCAFVWYRLPPWPVS